MNKCRICNGTYAKVYNVKEMMFGLLDEFEYFQCLACHCLQISHIPRELSKYYPSNYYSYNVPKKDVSILENYLINKRDRYALLGKGMIGKYLCKRFPPNKTYELIHKTNVNRTASILDVGCGDGKLLNLLYQHGFNNLLGVDPFIVNDKKIAPGLSIRKATINDLASTYDLIMFNHSLEHLPDQLGTLQKARSMLSENGICLVRIPTVSSYVWEKYGVNWVELDAPRHFYLHSLESIRILAENSGLKIDNIEYDSTEFELMGSEQYSHDICQNSERSFSVNFANSIFTPKSISGFKKLAKRLNATQKGGRIALYLSK